jgi:hypothetical protein
VLAVIRDRVPILEVAHRFEVSRQAGHRWLRWYEAQGLAGLAGGWPLLAPSAHPQRRAASEQAAPEELPCVRVVGLLRIEPAAFRERRCGEAGDDDPPPLKAQA